MVVKLSRFSDNEYNHYKNQFENSWLHPDKRAWFKMIYRINYFNTAFAQEFRQRTATARKDKFQVRYHGTRRSCSIGCPGNTEPCSDRDCYICRIIKNGFQINMYGTNTTSGMFGHGIYSTVVSSKADYYAKNSGVFSTDYAILLCKVICNRPRYLKSADHDRTSPGFGCNCVEAVTSDNGGGVQYKETIVYEQSSIIPFALLVYSRE